MKQIQSRIRSTHPCRVSLAVPALEPSASHMHRQHHSRLVSTSRRLTHHPYCSQTFQFVQQVEQVYMRFIIQHILGCRNILVDELSRPDKEAPMEWVLHPDTFTPGVPVIQPANYRPIGHQPELTALDLHLTSPGICCLSSRQIRLKRTLFPPSVQLRRVLQKIKNTPIL